VTKISSQFKKGKSFAHAFHGFPKFIL